MIDKEPIIFRDSNGRIMPSIKLPDAIKYILKSKGESYLLNTMLVVDLENCTQLHVRKKDLTNLQKLIEDGITDWLLDAADNDDGIVVDVADYAKEEDLELKNVLYLCNCIEQAIGGGIIFSEEIYNNLSKEEDNKVKEFSKEFHIKFRGVDFGLNYATFFEKLNEKVECFETTKYDGWTKITTSLLDVMVTLFVYYTPKSKKVYKITMFSYEWDYIDKIGYFKGLFTQKYGAPEIRNQFSENSALYIFYMMGGSVKLYNCDGILNMSYEDSTTYCLFRRESDNALLDEL